MTEDIKIDVENLSVTYEGKPALQDISLSIPRNQIFGIIGPANSGKTTFLKCINRTIQLVTGARTRGTILIDDDNIFSIRNVNTFRQKIGMVFPLPVGLPISIYENVTYAPKLAGIRVKAHLDEIVETCLTRAALWDEVKDRLHTLGTRLSGGQQQRLTIARALSHEPEILCLDEFSIAIDPVTTMKIEDALEDLKKNMTIILVTNLIQQARRLATRTAFFNDSKLIEVDDTEVIFSENPANRTTYDYIHGNFG